MKLTVGLEGVEGARAMYSGFSERRLNAAIATALTWTAKDTKAELLRVLPTIFDRPNPWTMGSLFIEPARADKLQSRVWFKDQRTGQRGTPAAYYLLPNVKGGGRKIKGFEAQFRRMGVLPAGWQVVPGQGAQLDVHGNVSVGQIRQVVAQLRLSGGAGPSLPTRKIRSKVVATERAAGGRFFVVQPGAKLQPGIYQREFIGRSITPVFIFVRSSSYRARFDFYGLATKFAGERLALNLDRALAESAQRLVARGQP